jgi:hypothetical protein
LALRAQIPLRETKPEPPNRSLLIGNTRPAGRWPHALFCAAPVSVQRPPTRGDEEPEWAFLDQIPQRSRLRRTICCHSLRRTIVVGPIGHDS